MDSLLTSTTRGIINLTTNQDAQEITTTTTTTTNVSDDVCLERTWFNSDQLSGELNLCPSTSNSTEDDFNTFYFYQVIIIILLFLSFFLNKQVHEIEILKKKNNRKQKFIGMNIKTKVCSQAATQIVRHWRNIKKNPNRRWLLAVIYIHNTRRMAGFTHILW
jgi:hypothetical protein